MDKTSWGHAYILAIYTLPMISYQFLKQNKKFWIELPLFRDSFVLSDLLLFMHGSFEQLDASIVYNRFLSCVLSRLAMIMVTCHPVVTYIS